MLHGKPARRAEAVTTLLRGGHSQREANRLLDEIKREAEVEFFKDLVPASLKFTNGSRGVQWAVRDIDGHIHYFGSDEAMRLLMTIGYKQRDAIRTLEDIRRNG